MTNTHLPCVRHRDWKARRERYERARRWELRTTGIPDSIPGDSGGPVWQVSASGAVFVGIWLGEHIDSGGTHYGRFISLADIADQIGKTHFVV